jgi:hypothetical protein
MMHIDMRCHAIVSCNMLRNSFFFFLFIIFCYCITMFWKSNQWGYGLTALNCSNQNCDWNANNWTIVKVSSKVQSLELFGSVFKMLNYIYECISNQIVSTSIYIILINCRCLVIYDPFWSVGIIISPNIIILICRLSSMSFFVQYQGTITKK